MDSRFSSDWSVKNSYSVVVPDLVRKRKALCLARLMAGCMRGARVRQEKVTGMVSFRYVMEFARLRTALTGGRTNMEDRRQAKLLPHKGLARHETINQTEWKTNHKH
jgi:hypothetical protein